MKILILIVLIALIYCVWKFLFHTHRDVSLDSKQFDLRHWLKPVQTKAIAKEPAKKQVISIEDMKRFDDVAKLLFEKQIRKGDLHSAAPIQSEFLNKMPAQTESEIKQFDLGEWSIFWAYKNQSLEYYASRYGIFYTHVDAEGIEHKFDLKFAV